MATEDVLGVFDLGGVTEAPASRWLPEHFWTARPALAAIRQAAHARQRSADAVLQAVLARIAAAVPHTIKLPPIVGSPAPLCHFAVILAPPGSGKGNAVDIAGELVPVGDHVADQLPLGSGEGLVEALFDVVSEVDPDTGKTVKVKRQVRHNAVVYVDEGDVLGALGSRSGATVLSVLRSIWSGKVVGQTNASAERKRIVPAGTYTYGVVVGIQDSKAGSLLADVDAGTPQRFAWSSAVDPNVPVVPPPWPGGLGWTPPSPGRLAAIEDRGGGGYVRHFLEVADPVADEVRANDLSRTRGEVIVDPWQAHADLLRLKVAGLLAILDGRLNVDTTDWGLAGLIKGSSDATVAHAQAVVAAEAARRERSTSDRLARRQIDATAAVEGWRTIEAARRIRRRVEERPGVTTRELQQALRRWRAEFHDGLAHALAEGWIEERSEPGQGTDRRTMWPAKEAR